MTGPAAAPSDGMPPSELITGFAEFLKLPENQAALQRHFKGEVKRAHKAEEEARARHLRDAVFSSSLEVQKRIGPFLKHRSLRRVITTFANDENGDFERWASNPRALALLAHAGDLLDSGAVTEDELEGRMVRLLQDPGAEVPPRPPSTPPRPPRGAQGAPRRGRPPPAVASARRPGASAARRGTRSSSPPRAGRSASPRSTWRPP